MATPLLQSSIDPMQLLNSILGGSVNVDESIKGTEQTNATQGTTGSQSQNQTGNTTTSSNSTQASTGSQNTTGSSTQTGTQSQTGTNNAVTSGSTTQNQTVQGSADIAGLQEVLAKQQLGVTPEMLTALFTQGAQQVPSLVTAFGNAAGARAVNNSPLQANIQALQAKLTQQAALMQQSMMSDASATAGRIADATRSQTTTGTTDQNSTQTGTTSQTGTTQQAGTSQQGVTSQQTTDTSSNQLVQQLLNTLMNSQQTQTVDQTKASSQNKELQQNSNINDDRLLSLLGLMMGGSVLNQAIPGGISGGVSSATGGIAEMLKGLFGQSTGQMDQYIQDLISGSTDLSTIPGGYDGTEWDFLSTPADTTGTAEVDPGFWDWP